MNIAVTGFEGGLVRDKLVSLGCTPINADITLEEELVDNISHIKPDVVIHTASITSVDKCETNPHAAFMANVRGSTYVAGACNQIGAHMIYLSTCHIFDGKGTKPYKENSIPRPKNVYGMTKWMGEVSADSFTRDLTVIRISKIFSAKTFQGEFGSPINRPSFIVRNYIHLDHFCDLLLKVAMKPKEFPKTLNISSEDDKSNYALWFDVFQALDRSTEVVSYHIDNPTFVPRPHYGVLDVHAAFKCGLNIPTIDEGIELLVKEMEE